MSLFHFYSEYTPKDPAALERQRVAKITWTTQPWRELPISDLQLSRLWEEEGRFYPYLRDLFNFAAEARDPDDILIFTNSDICVRSDCAEQIALALQDTEAAYCYRRDFNHDFSEPIPDDLIARGHDYVGSDLYAFRAYWWEKHWALFPDMLIGHELGDPLLRLLIDFTNVGHPTILQNLIYHRRHDSWWERAENRYRLKGQLHNLRTGSGWLRAHKLNPPGLRCPGSFGAMRILGWTLGYWNNAEQAKEQWKCLSEWWRRMVYFFHPVDLFIASGTWSDPALSPIPVQVVNSGAPHDKPYDYHCQHYGCCAFSAALFYALNRNDWDYLVTLDTDSLVGAVHFPKLFQEFDSRSETLTAPGWNSGIGGPFMAWKRAGAAKLAHQRLYPNISEKRRPEIWENECRMIYGTDWWNPWPQHNTLDMRHDSGANPILQNWPFVSRPKPQFIDEYLKVKTSQAVPL